MFTSIWKKDLPEGCNEEDKDLLKLIKSNKCKCKDKKEQFQSFCRACYMVLPRDMREDLWLPWKCGFGKVYRACIQYLESQTSRFSQNNTTSSQTFTSSSGKKQETSSGKLSKDKKTRFVSVQETSPMLEEITTWLTSNPSVEDLEKPSSYQVTTNITEVIRQVCIAGFQK